MNKKVKSLLATAVLVGSFGFISANIPFFSIRGSQAQAGVTVRNDYVWMDMPQTGNQNDKWSCGPTSAARVINFYGHNVNRDSLVNAINRDFVIPPSINVPRVPDFWNTRRVDIRTGTTPHALRDVMKRWEGDNVKLERKADFNRLLGLLRQGKPVIALIRDGSQDIVGTTWPIIHWIVIHGFSESKQEIYYTQTYDGGTYRYSYSEFQSKWDWRVGDGLASESLYRNGVEPKTMIWVDRIPNVVAQAQAPSSSFNCGNNIEIRPTNQNLTFSRGTSWETCNGYLFVFQDDGNLVLYNRTRQPLWASNTRSSNPPNLLAIQTDGNMVLYRNGNPVWAVNPGIRSGAFLAIQTDGNVVLYDNSGAYWSTNTRGR